MKNFQQRTVCLKTLGQSPLDMDYSVSIKDNKLTWFCNNYREGGEYIPEKGNEIELAKLLNSYKKANKEQLALTFISEICKYSKLKEFEILDIVKYFRIENNEKIKKELIKQIAEKTKLLNKLRNE